MMPREAFRKESIERWTGDLAPETRQADLLIYQAFKTQIGLDPFDLLVEALVLKGFGESTATQYYRMMHSYFVKNRAPLRKVERPRALVLIGNLFNSPD
jgi:hypothetical protein